MKKLFAVAASLVFLVGQQAHAFGVGPAVVYNDLTWNFSSNVSGLSSCNSMRLDGNGNLAASSKFVAYGGINCPALGGSYAATGSGYLGTDGTFNMTLTFGAGNQLLCLRINASTLSGTCNVFNSSGTQIGTAAIGYVP